MKKFDGTTPKNMHARLLLQATALVLLLLPLPGSSQSKPPIRIGAISTLSGAGTFKESADAARAYFDRINRDGGIQGRRIDYISQDDQSNPEAARQAARKLVDLDKVVLMVGGASILDCSTNGHYYQKSNIVSVVGGGIQPDCFRSANISPVNAGPYISLANALSFASQVRKHEKVCAVTLDLPGMTDGYRQIISAWSRHYGKKPALVDYGYQVSSKPGPFIDKTMQAGCQAVIFTGSEPFAADWLKSVRAKNTQGIDWIFLTPAYTKQISDMFGADRNLNIYAMSEFEPWSSRSSTLTDWSILMTDAKQERTSLSQAGYLAAHIAVKVLRGITGEIDRESISAAFKTMAPIDTQISGTAYGFGQGTGHSSNRAALPMKLVEKYWRVAHYTWIDFPVGAEFD